MFFPLASATVFLSAFLLFLIQPILAKLILPRFGGSAAVWATCLVFFQAAMLAGYAAAHALVRADRHRWLRILHVAALVGSLLVLPIVPAAHWQARADLAPSITILGLLVATIGFPFVLLATTSPLLQAWIAAAEPRRNVFRLFAVSNLASLLALVAYPWAIEPYWPAQQQALAWSAGYAAYVLAVAVLAAKRWRAAGIAAPDAGLPPMADYPAAGPAPSWRRFAGWAALAALASYELVAVTNHLTQNVPSFPMMWIAPLALYLLSFTLTFDSDRWYRPLLFRVAMIVALAGMAWMLADSRWRLDLAVQSGTFLAGLFVACMFCHGELASRRPAATYLTQFYLAVAAGGVVGGALVALGAPALFNGYYEVEIGLVLLAAAVVACAWRRGWAWMLAGGLSLLGTGGAAAYVISQRTADVQAMSRNFYGVVRVREYGERGTKTHRRTLMHGSIMHGEQPLLPEQRRLATSYYTETSGVGRLLASVGEQPLTVGVVGLGAGTLATYGKPGDNYRFYDIDPAVADAARRWFSYLADSAAAVEVRIGDGRLLLRDEKPGTLDVLVVDAFSGDSIPVHLLTREALALYADRTTPGGRIALHLSNRYLDLRPVVQQLAKELGLTSVCIEDEDDDENPLMSSSTWMLLARDPAALAHPEIADAASTDLPPSDARHAWTDDYSNILGVMRWR